MDYEKINVMTSSLPLPRLYDNKTKSLAPVIPISSIERAAEKKVENVAKTEKKGIPQFYTEPIFKAKEYDFL